MRKLFFSFLIIFITVCTVALSWAGLPDWVIYEFDKYPVETFFFEIGKSNGTGEEAFEGAIAEAHKNAAIRVLKKVNRIFDINKYQAEHSIVRQHYSSVLDDYCVSYQGESRQEAPALRLDETQFSVRNLSVDLARTDQHTYALVYIERKKFENIYADRMSSLRQKIKYRLKTARAAEEDLDRKGAVKTYLQTYPLYEALKEARIIQVAAKYGHTSNFSEAFRELVPAAMETGEDFWTHRQVIKRVEKLAPQIITSLDDVASTIKFQLLQQGGAFVKKVHVGPLVYEDSGTVCLFTEGFKNTLQKALGWETIDGTHNFTSKRFRASCWENGDEIIIQGALRDVVTGEFLASTVARFLNSQLSNSLTCKSDNHERAQVERKFFSPQYYGTSPVHRSTETSASKVLVEHQFSPVGGLEIEVWTDKGNGPMSYTEGETMKVFARVNQPAYIRLLYTLADGERTLLQDNYHIDASQINSSVEIGEFICTPPFGAEMLFVAARTEPFSAIKTRKENGYIFLEDQDAKSAARRSRGMQRIKGLKEQLSPDFQQSEAQLVITTMKE